MVKKKQKSSQDKILENAEKSMKKVLKKAKKSKEKIPQEIHFSDSSFLGWKNVLSLGDDIKLVMFDDKIVVIKSRQSLIDKNSKSVVAYKLDYNWIEYR